MPRERPLLERIAMVKMFYELQDARAVTRAWGQTFATAPPHRMTVLWNVEKFEETGSVKMRSGKHERSVLHTDNLQAVADLVAANEGLPLSVRQGAAQLGLARDSYHRALKELGLKCYRPQLVVELSDDDFDRRMQHCETWLQKFAEEPQLLDNILWSDESEFRLNGHVNKHNCCYWSHGNPRIQIPVSNDRHNLHVWCGISSNGILGPYFFDGTVTGASYLTLLREFAAPHLTMHNLYLQQDGAPAHYALIVRDWLNQNLPNRWIGRRGPFEWPARSPDLTPCDFFLWGYLKDQVYSAGHPATLEELRTAVQEACDAVPADMCTRVCRSVASRLQDCMEAEGKQLPY